MTYAEMAQFVRYAKLVGQVLILEKRDSGVIIVVFAKEATRAQIVYLSQHMEESKSVAVTIWYMVAYAPLQLCEAAVRVGTIGAMQPFMQPVYAKALEELDGFAEVVDIAQFP